jgi:hypothetical protein
MWCAQVRSAFSAAADRHWPIWKVGYFALMGALGLVAVLSVLVGLMWALGGGGPF